VTFRCKQHPVCKECAARFFEDKLAVGALPKCPVEGCGADAGAQLAQAVLTYVDFNKFLLANLRATKRLQNCPDCGALPFSWRRTGQHGRVANAANALVARGL